MLTNEEAYVQHLNTRVIITTRLYPDGVHMGTFQLVVNGVTWRMDVEPIDRDGYATMAMLLDSLRQDGPDGLTHYMQRHDCRHLVANIRNGDELFQQFYHSLANRQFRLYHIFLSYGVNVNLESAEGDTILIEAVRGGFITAVRELLHGHNADCLNRNAQWTALQLSSQHPLIMHEIIAFIPDINYRDEWDMTPLMSAVEENDYQLVEALLALDTIDTTLTCEELTAEDRATNDAMRRLFVQYGHQQHYLLK